MYVYSSSDIFSYGDVGSILSTSHDLRIHDLWGKCRIFSSYFQPRSRARVPLIYNNRIALVLGILSVSMGFHL